MLRCDYGDLFDPTGRANDPERTCAVAARFGLRLAEADDIEAAHAIATARIGGGIASVALFCAVQELTRASVFVYGAKGAVSGMIGLFFLRQSGLAAIERGQFDASNFDLELVAPPNEPASAAYGWGFVATSAKGGHAVVQGAIAFRNALSWAIPTFTRTATPDGVRIIRGPMRYEVFRKDDPTLVWLAPVAQQQALSR